MKSNAYKAMTIGWLIEDKDVLRFVSKLKLTATGCLEFQGAINENGYGRFWMNGMAVYAHRFSFVYHRGDTQSGIVLHHKCLNRCCCNPFHLEPVTVEENLRLRYES